ncbi:Alpha/beta hydrolase fold-1 [Elsinoe ampelina]|uniref:Alpha/beta hydrolase fold-1 n=1 Tax=Elsinoe ampelina TaxID=302913 RepID=A0A6A6G3J7_9PEZI|nr:Alpha/beta hydrolase fold-1 [Elsinoe ampelina]
MTKPTIVLVPGSFSPPAAYTEIISLLRAASFPAAAIQLPTTTKRYPLEPATLADDAAHIRRVAETLIGQGKEVVVVCHSYGGAPTSEALVGVGVKRIIYMTSIAPKVGEDIATALGGDALSGIEVKALMTNDMKDGYMHIDASLSAGAIANDMSWELAYEKVLLFPHHSAVSFSEPLTQAAYKEVPVSYILCTNDLIVKPDQQRQFIDNIQSASSNKASVVEIDSGHCPMWSVPEKLRDVIISEVEK